MRSIVVLVLLGAYSHAFADTTTDIAEQEARIVKLRSDLAPLVAPLQTSKADLRVFVSLEPFIIAVAGLNNLPAAQRTVSMQSIRAKGHFYENNDLCNSFVELQGPGDLRASALLSAFKAIAQPDGSLLVTAHADIRGHVQAHWHFFGVRVKPFFGGGICPPGGGVGGSIGADIEKAVYIKARFEFAMSPDGQAVSYRATLVEPRKVDVTISVGIQHLGSVGLPTSFDAPAAPFATGRFPLLLARGGKFVVPGEKGTREYDVNLKPASFAASAAGVVAEWTAAIDFKTRTP